MCLSRFMSSYTDKIVASNTAATDAYANQILAPMNNRQYEQTVYYARPGDNAGPYVQTPTVFYGANVAPNGYNGAPNGYYGANVSRSKVIVEMKMVNGQLQTVTREVKEVDNVAPTEVKGDLK